eukprot:5096390-Pyramimonas_sp.AAC.1
MRRRCRRRGCSTPRPYHHRLSMVPCCKRRRACFTTRRTRSTTRRPCRPRGCSTRRSRLCRRCRSSHHPPERRETSSR